MSVIKVKKLTENAQLPSRGSAAAAGYDLYASFDEGVSSIVINPHETKIISTGLSMELPEGTFLGIYSRSGLASKKGLRPANCVGVVDSDYRGPIMIALHNDSINPQEIEQGERIAQGILHSFIPMTFQEVEELEDTERGNGGFGSTGIK